MKPTIRVLHLEDNPLDAELIQQKLRKGGLACDAVLVAGKEGFEAAIAGDVFDLILCDQNLPDYDGMSALALARERLPLVPVISLSGTLGDEQAVECLKLGATDYVLKHRLERLVPAVRRALKDAEEHRERLTAEAALRESEKRNRAILETAMDGFWMTDMQGRLLEVNKTYCQMTGYSEQELLARRIPDLEADETADDIAARIQKIMTQGQDRFESQHRRKDGSIFNVEVSVRYQPAKGGRMVGFVQDITERKRREDALRQQAEELLARNDRLNRFNRVAVGRESRMNELKREVNELCRKLGEPPRHQIAD